MTFLVVSASIALGTFFGAWWADVRKVPDIDFTQRNTIALSGTLIAHDSAARTFIIKGERSDQPKARIHYTAETRFIRIAPAMVEDMNVGRAFDMNADPALTEGSWITAHVPPEGSPLIAKEIVITPP